MADNAQNNILLNIEVKATEAVKNLANIKLRIDELRTSQKGLDRETEEGRKEYEKTSIQLKSLNNDYRQQQRQLQSLYKVQDLVNAGTETANKSLSEMQRELSNLRNVSFEGLKPETIEEINHRIADLNSSIQDYRTNLKGLDTGEVWANSVQAINLVVASASALTNTMKLFGIDADGALGKLQERTTELIAGIQALSVVTDFLTKRKGALLAANLKNIAAMALERAGTLASSAAMLILGKSTDTTSKAFTRLRAAILASGVGAIIVGLVALVAVIVNLAKANNDTAKQQARLNNELANTERRLKGIKDEADFDQNIAKASGASVEKIRKIRLEAVRAQIALAEMMSDKVYAMGNKATQEQIEQARKMLQDAYAAEKSYFDDSTVALVQSLTDKRKKIQNNAIKLLDQQKKLQDESFKQQEDALKLQESLYGEDFAANQKLQQQKFEDDQKYQRERLALQLQFKQITLQQYNDELAQLQAQNDTFRSQQLNSFTRYANERKRELSALINRDINLQIEDATRAYNRAIADFDKLMKPQQAEGQTDKEYESSAAYEKYMFDRAVYEVELKQWLENEKFDIAERYRQIQSDAIEKAILRDNQTELDLYIDNQRKRNETEILMLEEQIQRKKEANLSTAQDEAELRALQADQNRLNYENDLLLSNQTAKQKYDLRAAYLQQELEIWEGNADKENEIRAQQLENETELFQARIEMFEQYAAFAQELISGIDEYQRSVEEAELQRYEEDNEKKKESLEKQLNNGTISQKNYNKQIEALDKDLDAKQAEIARKQAIREKAMRAFDIIINTALGVTKAVAASPLTGGLPFSAIVAALGAVQLGLVLSQPLPKASRGMLLNGPSHAQGGIPIEAEGGEAIINRRSTALFAPLLSAINTAGGGVPFTAPMTDGGYSARTIVSESAGITKEELTDVFQQLKIYTAVEDINDGQRKYTELSESKTY